MQFRFPTALSDPGAVLQCAVRKIRFVLLAFGAAAPSVAPAQTVPQPPLSSWKSEAMTFTMDSTIKNPTLLPASGPLSLSPYETDPARDLRANLRLDLSDMAHVDQQNGIEFVTMHSPVNFGLATNEAPALAHFSGTSLTCRPISAFDVTLGGRVQQQVQSSGTVPSEAFTHSVTFGSTPHADSRIELRLLTEDRILYAGPKTDTQTAGLSLNQRLPGTKLRLTLAPEVSQAETTTLGAPEMTDVGRLAGGLSWEIAPGTTWAIGSQFENSQSASQLTERQRITSGIQLRPAQDFGLALATEYGETRNEATRPGNVYDPAPDRDLHLRLSPSLSLGKDVTARVDFDMGLRDSPQSDDWGQGSGAVSFSIGGRF